jgi:hypothetical protein
MLATLVPLPMVLLLEVLPPTMPASRTVLPSTMLS